MDVTGLLSAGWWDGVAAIAGVLSLGSLVSALVLWARSRHRLDDGRIVMDSWRGPDGRWTLRMQNIGERVCVIRMMLVHDVVVPAGEPPTGALPPAGERLIPLDGVGSDSEVVVAYGTSGDAGGLWLARFEPGLPADDILDAEPLRGLPLRARREIRFRGDGPVFTHSGLARDRRYIPLGHAGGGRAVLRAAILRLLAAGYRPVGIPADTTASARGDSQAGRIPHRA
ncbi:hypothetical protein [Bifidobacterium myosotis]|uniref:Uncharacterized protein n=1 Tax=Bifidobacterium myosotis TaxID=1630166 RepID=A0A5M9ZFV8_9BIFI|nr:hypothetical protein [Bifidobacterium myosotis]KAA8825361.1 hypothetical protein EMO91_12405 [Bifidobacterium myosotis]